MMAQAVLFAAAVSERGRRPNNEDRTLCEPDLGVYGVIDGVGGGPCGENARPAGELAEQRAQCAG